MKNITNDLKDQNKNSGESMLADIKQQGMVMGGAVLIEERKLEKILTADSKELNKNIKENVGDELKKLNKTLEKVKSGLLNGSGSGTEKTSPKESTKLGDKETPVSFKEKLMSTVGGIKTRSEATKEFLKSPIKNIKESIGGFAANVQNKAYKGMQDIGDIISAPAGYNPEKEQFAKDYGLRTDEGKQRDQAKRNEMRERIKKGGYDEKETARRLKEADEYVSDETLAEGRKRYEATKGAQQELASARSDIEAVNKRGFNATDAEQARMESAQANLAAVDPRVKEAEQNLKEVKKEDVRAAEKENDDNVTTSSEIMAKSMEDNNVIIKELLDTTKQQLDSVKKISEAMAPKEPVDLDLQYQPVTKKLDELITTVKEKEFTASGAGDGKGGLLDAAKDALDIGKGKAGAPGKGPSIPEKAGRFGKLSKLGKIGGAALSIAGGAYTAYSGYSEASDEQDTKLADIEAKKKSGELTAAQADSMTKEVNAQATEKKGGAVGEGVGMAAGGIAGMQLGAAIGSFAGPVGTVVGGVAGGAIGAFAGSSLGKKAGELGGKVLNYFSGDKKQEVPSEGGTDKRSEYAKEASKLAQDALSQGKNPAEIKDIVTDKLQEKYKDTPRDLLEAVADRESFKVVEASKMSPRETAMKARWDRKEEHIKDVNAQTQAGTYKTEAEKAGIVNAAPGAPKSEGIALANKSTENADMIRESSRAPAAAPTIINNSSTSNGGGTQISPMKPVPRSYNNSPLDRHLDRTSSF